MGLIKAAQAATGTVMAISGRNSSIVILLITIHLVRGKKRTGAVPQIQREMTTSFPMVLELQWQMVKVYAIVDQKIAEVCAEPGEYTYDTSSEPSILQEI